LGGRLVHESDALWLWIDEQLLQVRYLTPETSITALPLRVECGM
jgi:hypothetical protein